MGRIAAAIGAVLVLVVASFAVPGGARAGSTDYDFAAGGGKTAYGDFAVSVNCPAVGPTVCTQTNGMLPSGHVNKHYPDPSTGKPDEIHGDVTCLVFNFPYTWITWMVTKSADSQYPVNNYYTFGVADTGGPANGSAVDLALLDQPSGPNDCTQTGTYSFNAFHTTGILSGQVQVHQASTTPGTTLSGSGWYTDSSGNLYVQDSSGNWVLVQ